MAEIKTFSIPNELRDVYDPIFQTIDDSDKSLSYTIQHLLTTCHENGTLQKFLDSDV